MVSARPRRPSVGAAAGSPDPATTGRDPSALTPPLAPGPPLGGPPPPPPPGPPPPPPHRPAGPPRRGGPPGGGPRRPPPQPRRLVPTGARRALGGTRPGRPRTGRPLPHPGRRPRRRRRPRPGGRRARQRLADQRPGRPGGLAGEPRRRGLQDARHPRRPPPRRRRPGRRPH